MTCVEPPVAKVAAPLRRRCIWYTLGVKGPSDLKLPDASLQW
jgi:hypothetical protein